MIRPNDRSGIDLHEISSDAELPEVIEQINKFIAVFSFFNKSLSFSNNFDGYIANVVFPASTEVRIQHYLGITPKFRVILKQEGNGVLSDIPSGWNDKVITILNNGVVEVKASILIARE